MQQQLSRDGTMLMTLMTADLPPMYSISSEGGQLPKHMNVGQLPVQHLLGAGEDDSNMEMCLSHRTPPTCGIQANPTCNGFNDRCPSPS